MGHNSKNRVILRVVLDEVGRRERRVEIFADLQGDGGRGEAAGTSRCGRDEGKEGGGGDDELGNGVEQHVGGRGRLVE